MLLNLLVLSAITGVVPGGTVIPAHRAPRTAIASHDRTPGLRVWTSRGDLYRRGDRVRVYYRTERDAFVTIFRIDTDGRLQVLFPRSPEDENLGYGGQTYSVSTERNGDAFYVDDYAGVGYIFGVASNDQFDYDAIMSGGHWDMRTVADGRIHGDPRGSMDEIVTRLVAGGYTDYDTHLIPYYVERRYDYPRFVCYDCHSYVPYTYWDPYQAWCRRFTLVVYNDPFYFYPSYWYPTRYYGGTRVVYSSPGNSNSRFVFRNRDNTNSNAPGIDYRDRRNTDVADASRRPEDRGVRGSDIGGTGSVPAPTQGGRRTGGFGGDTPRTGGDAPRGGGEDGGDRRRGNDASGAGGANSVDQGGRRRADSPGIEIVPRSTTTESEPSRKPERKYRQPDAGSGARPVEQRDQPVLRGDEARPPRPEPQSRPESREAPRDQPRDQPPPERRAEPAPRQPDSRPDSRAEPRRDPGQSSPPPRQAAPPSSPPPRQAAPPPRSTPQASPKLERRRPD